MLCGEMSLVGPRPLLDRESPRYGETIRLPAKVVAGTGCVAGSC